jgi:hypothetical protein
MPKDSFRISVASAPDWQGISAQIWSEDSHICDLHATADGRLLLKVLPSPDEPVWNLAHAEFAEAIERAKQMIGY